jgi:hypothetical protein
VPKAIIAGETDVYRITVREGDELDTKRAHRAIAPVAKMLLGRGYGWITGNPEIIPLCLQSLHPR